VTEDGMSTVIVGVERVEEEKYNTAVPSGPEPNHPFAPKASSKLSTFHMPRATEIVADSTGYCTFRFTYPNDEPPERSTRAVSEHVDVRLGKVSKKILEIRVRRAADFLRSGLPILPSMQSPPWIHEVPWDGRFACQRNAEVIRQFMAAMPDSIRTQISSQLDRLVAGKA
jgi:hypothetical protein